MADSEEKYQRSLAIQAGYVMILMWIVGLLGLAAATIALFDEQFISCAACLLVSSITFAVMLFALRR